MHQTDCMGSHLTYIFDTCDNLFNLFNNILIGIFIGQLKAIRKLLKGCQKGGHHKVIKNLFTQVALVQCA